MAQSINDGARLCWPSSRAGTPETLSGLREHLKVCDLRFEDLLCRVESSTSPGEDSPGSGSLCSFNTFNLSWHPTEGSQGHPELCHLSKAMSFSCSSPLSSYYDILYVSFNLDFHMLLVSEAVVPSLRCVLIWILSCS